MAVIAPPPAPIKPAPPSRPPVRTNGHPPPPNGNGHGGRDHNGSGPGDGHGDPEEFRPPKKRRSIWPFLLDLGLVMMLFGLIIIGHFLIVIGAVVFVVALTGWIREARKDFSGLAD